jgi:hypothetical protein
LTTCSPPATINLPLGTTMSKRQKDVLIKELIFLLYVNSELDSDILEARYQQGYYHVLSIEDLQHKITLIQENFSDVHVHDFQ